MAFDSDNIHKGLISLVIEQTLLEIGESARDKVGDRLYEKYECYFHDCLQRPEYLKDILEEIFGGGSKTVTEKIKNMLLEYENQKPILNFIVVLSK